MAGLSPRRVRRSAFVAALLAIALGASPAWAAAGARIAFTRGGDLLTVRPDGTRVRVLTVSERQERAPEWSPDRSRVAFVSAERTLRAIDADGSNEVALFSLPRRYDAIGQVAWSPDGDALAFTSEHVTRDDGSFRVCSQVWVLTDAGARRILSGRLAATGLTWSPDGRFLAASFEQASTTLPCRARQDPGMYRFRPDGSRLRDLGARFGTDPDWSPDGRRIVFRDWRRTCHACGQIWVMRADGARQRLLADPPRRYLGYYAPAWSPSGNGIAFLAQRNGRFSLWRMASDGSDLRRVRRHADGVDW